MAGKFGDFLKEIEESEFAKGGGFEIVGGVATDAIGALTSNSKYKGAQTGKAVGGGIGAAAGAVIGGPMGAKVGQALGGLAGGLIGGASDQKKMIKDYEDINYRKYSKLNLSANLDPYGSDNTFYMEDGGIVEGEETPSDSKVRAFYNNYIGSPKYRQRLKKQGHTDIDGTVNARKKQLAETKVITIPGGGGSRYMRKHNALILDPEEMKQYGMDPNSTLAHEMSHAGGALGSRYTRQLDAGMLNRNEINAIERRNRLSYIDTDNLSDEQESEIHHDRMAQETKADMDALRYRLKTDKVYDAGTQDFTPAHLKKAKGMYKKDPTLKRLFNNFKDADLIYLMNNIALQGKDAGAMFAADGGVVEGGGEEDPKAIQAAKSAGTKAGQALIGLSTTGRSRVKKKTWKPEELFEFKDSQGIKTGRYPKQHLQGVIAAARAVGEDPYEAVAFVLQESSLGLDGNRNLGYTYQEPTDKQLEMIRDLSTKTGVESRYLEPLVLYKDKLAYAQKLGYKDKAFQIQAYNGLGVLTKQMVNGADKAYGIPIGDGIDMRKNPIYGKRVLALAADLKNNPYIKTLMADGTAVARMEEGGMVDESMAAEGPQKQLVNIELGELLINPENLEIVRKYDNKNRYKPHARKQFNEAMGNFTLIEEGMVVIPKKHAEAFEKGDTLARKSLVATILKDQAKRPETRMPRMKLGGEIGGPGDDLPFVDSLDGMMETAITQHQLFTPGRGGTFNAEYPYPNRQVPQVEIPDYGANMTEDIKAYNTPKARRTSSVATGDKAPVNLTAGLAGRNAGPVDIDTDIVEEDDQLTGGGTNWAQKLSKAGTFLPTAIGVMNALGHDPYLRYDENTQYDTAKAYIQNSPTDVNIEGSKAAIRRRAANTNRALLNVNSPAVRAEIAAGNADRISAEGDLVQNAINLSTQARQRKSESLARLEEAQGASRLNMRQKFQEELRQDAANRRMMIQAGVSEGVTNYRKAVVEDEKIRAINTMSRYHKLTPDQKELLFDTKMFGEDALDYIITRSGNGLTAGKTGSSGVVKTTTDGKGRVKSKTVTTKG